MAFNSLWFVFFFCLFYLGYLLLSRFLLAQNLYLLIGSLLFYGTWHPFLPVVLLGLTAVVYAVALTMEKAVDPKSRNFLLVFVLALTMGMVISFRHLNSFLPIAGISFFSFQLMGYLLDVYHGRLPACRDPLAFALFASFFPQLIAGPIGRAPELIPQYQKRRTIDPSQINAALFLILWGYFQKTVVADNLARIVANVFGKGPLTPSVDVIIAELAFMFQLYGDFAGYSNISRGIAKLMGIELQINFILPYFSENPTDFWNRWHISLSHWFRDYLYTPLAITSARFHESLGFLSVFVTMVLIGFWHGSSWPFIVFGAYHGLLIIGHRLFVKHAPAALKTNIPGPRLWKMGLMFLSVLIGMVIFRAPTMGDMFQSFASMSLRVSPNTSQYAAALIFFVTPLVVMEIWQLAKRDLLVMAKTALPLRVVGYGTMLVMICLLGYRMHRDFLYFQF